MIYTVHTISAWSALKSAQMLCHSRCVNDQKVRFRVEANPATNGLETQHTNSGNTLNMRKGLCCAPVGTVERLSLRLPTIKMKDNQNKSKPIPGHSRGWNRL